MNRLDLFSFNYRYPVKSISKKEISDASYVLLGHLTSSIFLDNILLKGLIAQSETYIESVGGHENNNDKEYIYLSRELDTFFSSQSVKKFGGKEILVIVEIPLTILETDPYGGNTTSTDIMDILNVITKTNRNFRVHKKIEKNMIIGIYDVSDLRYHISLLKNTIHPIPYLSVYKNFKNILNLKNI